MNVKESYLRFLIRRKLFESRFLTLEGPHDPSRLKAIFMAGCPGSGKGTVIRGIFGRSYGSTYQGMKIVNPDQVYELLLKKSGLPLTQPDLHEKDPELKAYQSAAGKLQYAAGMKMTGGSAGISPGHVMLEPSAHGYKPAKKQRGPTRLEMHINNQLGVIIDGTAANYTKIEREKKILEDLGYSTMMIAVSVPVDVALDRNQARGEKGDRSIHPDAVKRTCERLNPNFSKYAQLWGEDYIEIDNTRPIAETLSAHILSKIDAFISSPLPTNKAATVDLDGDQHLSPGEIRDLANKIENQNS